PRRCCWPRAPAASNSASAPRVSPASWQRQAVSHFRKFRRQVSVRTRGVARVAVTIDRGGRVLSARLASSSGNAEFDDEAVALVRRASPIPAPPDGVGGKTLSLTVPVNM
ncbi:MAG: energy transducer TonB, partial [Brevundimonas sp.]